jgi:hypothetical protein
MECTVRIKFLYAAYALLRLVGGVSPRRTGVNPTNSMWDLQWTKWRWDRLRSILLFIFQATLNKRTNERSLLTFQQKDILRKSEIFKIKRSNFILGTVLFP